MTKDERLIALANGEPVGVDCTHCGGTAMRLGSQCDECWGTGRIRTEPANDAERMVALLRYRYEQEQQALAAEQAAHQATRDTCKRWHTDGMGATDAIAELEAAHEETKRQLAEIQAVSRVPGAGMSIRAGWMGVMVLLVLPMLAFSLAVRRLTWWSPEAGVNRLEDIEVGPAGTATVESHSLVVFDPKFTRDQPGDVPDLGVRPKLKGMFLLMGPSQYGQAAHRYLIRSPWLTAEYVDHELVVTCGAHMRCRWEGR